MNKINSMYSITMASKSNLDEAGERELKAMDSGDGGS